MLLTGVKIINEAEFSELMQFWVRNHEHFSVLNNNRKHRRTSLTHNDRSSGTNGAVGLLISITLSRDNSDHRLQSRIKCLYDDQFIKNFVHQISANHRYQKHAKIRQHAFVAWGAYDTPPGSLSWLRRELPHHSSFLNAFDTPSRVHCFVR